MLGFVTLTLPALQDWGFRGMGQRWALSLLCLQSVRWVEARTLRTSIKVSDEAWGS